MKWSKITWEKVQRKQGKTSKRERERRWSRIQPWSSQKKDESGDWVGDQNKKQVINKKEEEEINNCVD